MRSIIILAFLPLFIKAQIDSAMTIPLLGINFGGQLPLFELSDRFGPNLNAGGSFLIKTRKNWVVGLESSYIFGRNVKEDVLKQLKNSEGYITDNQGNPADLRVTERGLGIHVVFGRVFRLRNTNPNSGIIVTFGVGYLQHKINLYDAQRSVAAVNGDLKHGYDRLSAGLSFSQFIGYLYLSENRMLNFYVGFEGYQALTKSIRKLNYDTGLPDTKQRFDGLTGFRVGWILPLYKKKPSDYYYN